MPFSDCRDGTKGAEWLEFQPLNRLFTGYAQKSIKVADMILFGFPENNGY